MGAYFSSIIKLQFLSWAKKEKGLQEVEAFEKLVSDPEFRDAFTEELSNFLTTATAEGRSNVDSLSSSFTSDDI